MENKKYMVLQIGCIECGVSSYPIGVYNTLEEAREVEKNHPSTWDSEHGDGYTEIWAINENNETEMLSLNQELEKK